MKYTTQKIIFGLLAAGYGYYLLTIIGVVRASIALMLIFALYIEHEGDKIARSTSVKK